MKNVQKISALILALLMIAAGLCACTNQGGGENQPSAPTLTTAAPTATDDGLYSVTLLDNNGQPIVGASVMITNETTVFKSGTTDADGKFSVAVTGNGLGVMIVHLPTGYTMPAAVSGELHAVFGTQKAVTVTVQKETTQTVTYTVKVVDQTGVAVVGATVQVCHGTNCYPDFMTDANGIATKELAPNLALDVKILALPDGYTKPEALDNGYHAKIEAGSVEVTVTVTKN